MQLVKPISPSPLREDPDVSDVELHFKTLSVPRIRTNDAAQERESKAKIGNRPCRLIYLPCIVIDALIVIVARLSIYGSQIRQCKITSDQNCHESTSILQSSLSALNSNLSDLKRRHSDLRYQFTEMETKYRSVNKTKAQICELLTSRREQECLQYWIGNEGGCYFITTLKRSYDKAMQYCWDSDSKLLEINSAEEANFVNKAISEQDSSYWIGKCKDGKFASNVLYRMTGSDPECGVCTHDSERKPCDQVHTGFICEKSGYLFPEIYEMIKDLCQQPVGPT